MFPPLSVVIEISYVATVNWWSGSRSLAINGLLLATRDDLECIEKIISLGVDLPEHKLYPGVEINSRQLKDAVRVVSDPGLLTYLAENEYLEIGDVTLLKSLLAMDRRFELTKDLLAEIDERGFECYDEIYELANVACVLGPGAASGLVDMKEWRIYTYERAERDRLISDGPVDIEDHVADRKPYNRKDFLNVYRFFKFERLAVLSVEDAEVFSKLKIPFEFFGLSEISMELAEVFVRFEGDLTIRLPNGISPAVCRVLAKRNRPLDVMLRYTTGGGVHECFAHAVGPTRVRFEVNRRSICIIPERLKICSEMNFAVDYKSGTLYQVYPSDCVSLESIKAAISRGDCVSVLINDADLERLLQGAIDAGGPLMLEFKHPTSLSHEQIDLLCSKSGYLVISSLMRISHYFVRKLSERRGRTVIGGVIDLSISHSAAKLLLSHGNIEIRDPELLKHIRNVAAAEMPGANDPGGSVKIARERIAQYERDIVPGDWDEIPF